MGAFGKGGSNEAFRFNGNRIEERQRQILELIDFAVGWAGEGAECGDRRAEKPVGLARFVPDGELPEIRR